MAAIAASFGVPPADEAVLASRWDRRVDLVKRLMARGLPMRTLEVLLPGWEQEIAAVVEAT